MDINPNAPVVASSEIEITAAPEVVWGVISEVANWPAWNPAIKSVQLSGPVEVGKSFRWKTGPGSITSTIRELEPPRMIGWSGRTMGIKALHVYRLDPSSSGTVVRTAESWEGMVASILRKALTKQLQASLDPGLECLKAEAERRSAASDA